jgi:SSS family solute:Na+ symporter
MNLLAFAAQSNLPLWMVGAYLVILLGLGMFSSNLFRGTSKDFFVASRSIGPFMLLMSVFGTTMTGFALVGSTGKAFMTGVAVFGAVAVWSGIVHSSVFFMIGTRLWAIGKRLGYVTQVQFFRERFKSHTLGTVLFVLLVLFIIPYLLIGIISAGKFMQGTAGLDPRLTGLVICSVVLTYVFMGGVRSAAWANTFQTLVFMLTGIVAFAMIAKSVAAKTEEGSGTFLENVKRSTELVEQVKPERLVRGVHPEKLNRYDESKKTYMIQSVEGDYEGAYETWKLAISEHLTALLEKHGGHDKSVDTVEFEALGSLQRQEFAFVITELISGGAAEKIMAKKAMPHSGGERERVKLANLHQEQLATAKIAAADDSDIEKQFTALVLLELRRPEAPIEPVAPRASMSRLLWITYLFIPLSVGMFPHVFQHWLTAKSAKTFRLAIVAHPICIALVWLPCVFIGTWAAGLHAMGELTVPVIPGTDRPNPSAVLGAVVGQLVQNSWLMGLLMIGVLAAIMSSLDSQFACLGTMFTNDIVLPWKGKDYYSDRDTVKIARCFVTGVVVASYLLSLGLMKTASVFNLGVWCFSGFTALFPIIFAALYWKRATAVGAYACIVVTGVLWILWFRDSGYGADKGYTVLGMLPMAPLTIVSAMALIVGSLATKAPEGRTINKFFPNSTR